MGSLFVADICFARHCQGTLRRACFFSVTCIWPSEREYLPLSQIRSADETLLYFNMPSLHAVDDGSAKYMVIQTWGYKKMHFTVMLAV